MGYRILTSKHLSHMKMVLFLLAESAAQSLSPHFIKVYVGTIFLILWPHYVLIVSNAAGSTSLLAPCITEYDKSSYHCLVRAFFDQTWIEAHNSIYPPVPSVITVELSEDL